MKKEKQNKKKRWTINSGNGHKIREIRLKRWGSLWWEGFIENVSFESRVELMRWGRRLSPFSDNFCEFFVWKWHILVHFECITRVTAWSMSCKLSTFGWCSSPGGASFIPLQPSGFAYSQLDRSIPQASNFNSYKINHLLITKGLTGHLQCYTKTYKVQ